MKSAWGRRRLGSGSAAFENEPAGAAPPPKVRAATSVDRSSIIAATTVDVDVPVAAIETAATTCHCPSARGTLSFTCPSFPSSPTSTRVPEGSSWTSCRVCERLHGHPEESEDEVDLRSTRRARHAREDLAGMPSARTFDREKRIRHGPSSRCVSSVVRWSHRQPRWKHLSFDDGPDERAVSGAYGCCTGFTGSTPRKQTSFVWTILFLLVLAVPTLADVQQGAQHKSSRKDGVCQSIDIRNSVRSFSKLNGCRVVEGFVQILLINNAEPHEYANISFPELREITGYLLLHRVMGLRSVGHLFPNLQVIRGSSLLLNYALMAYEVMNLKEIGLHSLTTIVRGSVRIVENPSLCYVDTIDWDLIGKAGKGEHVVSGNNPRNGCPVCEKHCPVGSKGSPLCWNQQHCQRICDQKCENNACDENGNCCHPTCLGTCTGPTNRDCSVCKDVLTLEGDCQARCPNSTFEFMDHRCVEEEMCHQMRKPLEAYKVKDYPYKPFNGSCVIECPAGFMDKEINGKAYCKKCKGPCQKDCPGDSVESIASAQNLRGCTRITGNLVIQIRGGKNIVKELEDSLSRIEEIDGYLKVVRSFPLISLNFLKNLRVIRGNTVDNNKYTFVVFENQNLQELWDWSWHPTVQILSPNGPGKVFFHFNPKLCLYKIDALREKAGLGEFTDLEVASSSNGDKVACNVTELKTRAASKSPWGVVIEWEPFTHHDMRSLLGYVVYFIEAPYKNVTMYDGRDACGGDGWRVDDVPASRSANRSSKVNQTLRIQEEYIQTHYLTQLKPYTQYAYYVKTSTIATERSGGQSNITYFRTLPEAPTPPRFLTFACNSSSELIMSWLPPLQNNGNLTHYRITARLERDDPNFIDQRNYCDEPMSLPTKEEELASAEQEKKRIEEEKKRFEEERKQSALDTTGTCKCPDRETDQSLREKEATSSILFEDAVQNKVYVKRPSIKMKRDTFEKSIVATRSLRMSDQPIVNKLVNGSYVTFDIEVPSTNLTYVMKQLRHFALYNIEMRACRAQEVDDLYKRCSTKRMGTYRTLPLEGADNIPPNTFKLSTYGENNSLTTVTLQWEEPPQPNGLIITYHIEYNRVEAQNVTPTEVCVTRRNFVNAGNSYTLSKDLQAGNYSVRVRAMSLAGYGAHTETKYFYIKKHTVLGTFWVVFWSLLLFVALAIGVVALCVCKQKLVRNVRNMTLIATVNPEYVSTPYVIDEWEVPREKIEVLRPLGNGSFGMVYEGLAKDIIKDKPEVRCAVKTVNKDATERERNEFLNEASVMKGFDAHHVVKLLGVVTRGQPTLVIMELMVNGDLKTYLRSHRPGTCDNYTDTPPKLDRILRMAIEIADGMAYLATKKFVHRDLAARNCMVAEDLTVKVGDFGMTRDVYERDYYRKGTKGLLPVRWMAPESLKDGVFSSYSDVWSYGVVLWEMATFASQPYQGLSNDQVLRYVIEGGVMERPENCPELLYEMMKRTWIHKANRRPTFMDIAANLLEHVDLENFKRISFYHSPEGIEARNQNRSNSPPIEQHPELAVLQDLREEESEGEENSPLRQDFGDFASFKPRGIKNSLSPCHGLESYGENSKTTVNCHDVNSFNVPLKAGFDDFDGISGDSLTSGKDIFNPPLLEESLKSAKSSSFVNAKSPSRGNLRQLSMAKSGSPRNSGKRSYLSSPIPPKRPSPDYENGSPEILSSMEKREEVPLRVDFPLIDTDNGIEKKETMSTVEYVNKPESLNNGYISGTTT